MPCGKPVQEEGGGWDASPAKEAEHLELKALLRHIRGGRGEEIGGLLARWWLVHYRGSTKTPNWDIASTCSIKGQRGLLLVEAKAHEKELGDDKCGSKNSDNRERIRCAIAQANAGLKLITEGSWSLSRDSHYQLSNRFAWSWKLASLGVPVVLVYLGFLKAEEMVDLGEPFESEAHWSEVLKSYSAGFVDNGCWGHTLDVGGTPMLPLIRGYEQPLP